MTTEILRLEMIDAFKEYNDKFGDFREREWDKYIRTRELYLRALASERGAETAYVPLKETLTRIEH